MDIKSLKMEAKLWIDLQNKIKKLIIKISSVIRTRIIIDPSNIIKPNVAKLIN